MDWFFSLSPLLKVCAVFVLIVSVNARGLHLGLSALVGAAAVSLWSKVAPMDAMLMIGQSLIAADTVLLSALLAGILFLSSVMKRTGRLDSIVASYRRLVRSPRLATATLPAVIGVLPVPGGAVFSAPMVSAIDSRNELSPRTRAVANYWFRHMIELVWPLYPAFVLTSTLSGLSIPALMAVNAYAPFALIAVGALFLLPASFGKKEEAAPPGGASTIGAFLKAFSPVLIVVGSALVFDLVFGSFPYVPAALRRYLPSILGVSLAIAALKAMHPESALRKAFPAKAALLMIGTIAGIKAFSSVMDAIGAAGAVSAELAELGIPPVAVIALLPLIAGLVTGVGFGYVGLSLPIVLALIPAAASSAAFAASVALAGAFGFVGMMMSPLHVCMAVSAEHFGVRAAEMVRLLIKPAAAFLAAALLHYLIVSRF